jgi:hypothetical protein
VTNAIGSLQGAWEGLSTALLYEGDPITPSQGGGAWVPAVVAAMHGADASKTFIVVPSKDSPVDVVPGIWSIEDQQGVVCVVGMMSSIPYLNRVRK